jgi:hypothetical protein
LLLRHAVEPPAVAQSLANVNVNRVSHNRSSLQFAQTRLLGAEKSITPIRTSLYRYANFELLPRSKVIAPIFCFIGFRSSI